MGRLRRSTSGVVAFLAAIALVGAACSSNEPSSSTTGGGTSPSASAKPFAFGMILVGPYNDHGWTQWHYEAGQAVEAQTGGKMHYLDKVNAADRASVKAEDVSSQMIDNGSQLIIATSDDFKDSIQAAAAAHPDVPMIWSTGDSAWADG